MKRAINKSWQIAVIFFVLPLLFIEIWVSQDLFNHVSYTNSQNMDPQIKYFEGRNDWEFVAFGSSEVKWGIQPTQIEKALAAKDISASGFNLGFDGFNENFYLSILPFLKLPQRLTKFHLALIGINLIEEKQILPSNFDEGYPCDGILQRAVLKSAFAKDYDLYHLCNSTSRKQALVEPIENLSQIVRYRQSLRSLILGNTRSQDFIGTISNNLKQYSNGFHAHKSAKDNKDEVEVDYERFLAQEKTHPHLFQPMKSDAWSNLLQPDGFFERWANYFTKNQVLPVFFALPTNPLMIDAQRRREDYQRNSKLMKDWAKKNNVLFIDLGLLDNYDKSIDYSDHRHLSGFGGERYSYELGKALANNSRVLTAFSK